MNKNYKNLKLVAEYNGDVTDEQANHIIEYGNTEINGERVSFVWAGLGEDEHLLFLLDRDETDPESADYAVFSSCCALSGEDFFDALYDAMPDAEWVPQEAGNLHIMELSGSADERRQQASTLNAFLTEWLEHEK